MAAKEKTSFRWSAWLAPILFLLAAVAAAGPASALTCGALETRAWEKTPAPLEWRPVESLQLLNLHQQNGGAGYDDALGSPLAAENAGATSATQAPKVVRPADSPNYSVITEAKLKPGTFTASDANHFRQANRQLYELMQADPKFAAQLEAEYPGITAHVTPGPRGGFADTSPPGTTWHHDPNVPGNLQLVPRDQHRAPGPIQQSLHPNQQGGREIWGGGSANR